MYLINNKKIVIQAAYPNELRMNPNELRAKYPNELRINPNELRIPNGQNEFK